MGVYLPDTPSASIGTDRNFSHYYIMNEYNLGNISAELNDTSFLNSVSKLFNNPIDNVVSAHIYPIDMKKWFDVPSWAEPWTKDSILIGNVTLQSVGSKGYRTWSQMKLVRFLNSNNQETSIQITPHFNNFLDYSPYTKYELYLPYCGIVELNANDILNKDLRIRYAIDINDGSCEAYIVDWGSLTESGHIITSIKGQVGFSILLGGRDVGQLSKSLMDLSVNSLISSMSPMGLLNLPKAIMNLPQSMNPSINKVGSSGSTLSTYDPQSPYLIITRPIIPDSYVPTQSTDNYGNSVGYACEFYEQLKNLSGYTEILNIHIENLPSATDSELKEIENLLKNGVIL